MERISELASVSGLAAVAYALFVLWVARGGAPAGTRSSRRLVEGAEALARRRR